MTKGGGDTVPFLPEVGKPEWRIVIPGSGGET
jgi:hypothetical protein